jgi:hypothetical protein
VQFEEFLRFGDQIVVALVEIAGAVVIFVGAVWAALRFVVEGCGTAARRLPDPALLGGSSPWAWVQLPATSCYRDLAGLRRIRPAAIATIRTALNFLRREIEQERQVRTGTWNPTRR